MTDLPPGRELDAEVAKKMGWTEVRTQMVDQPDVDWGRKKVLCHVGNPPNGSSPAPLIRHIPHYSTDWRAAGEAIEEMRAGGWWCELKTPFGAYEPYWAGATPLGVTGWNGRPDIKVEGETGPHAISLLRLALPEETS